jgi:RNA polymerase sigma factor (sigma-70 family)
MAVLISAHSDAELLGEYAGTRSEAAFAEIVRRHINLVYSTSLRRVNDPHLAEDVTQSVFFVLAKKAGKISTSTVLAGWLYQTARFISRDAIKMKMRREQHEQIAARLRAESRADETWPKISPLLESAMDDLGSRDRDVILLRFFEGLEIGEIARAVGVPANTVSKRLQRAIERLRRYFSDRGVVTPAAAIGPAIATGAAQAAPAALMAACVGQAPGASTVIAALAKSALSAGSIWVKAAAGLLIGVAAVGATTMAVHSISSSPPAPPPASASAPMIAPALAGPLEPVSPDQERQIRVALYTLRHYTVLAQYNEWTKSIRTLVQIGPPAVPELVAELDRTSNDNTLRAMGFTLRAIGDPRACPALIRAIPRTRVLSGEFGFALDDKDLAAFMRKYEISSVNDYIRYTSAVHEISAALESITHRKATEPWTVRANLVSDADLRLAQKRDEAASREWQQWWELHHAEIVSDADLATLTAHPHELADVETAGIAVNGPLFPTGKPFHLGEVHDIYLRASDQGYCDESDVVDFDAQRKMTILEAMRLLPDAAASYSSDSVGADACCGAERIGHGMTHSDFFTLTAISDLVWPMDADEWDKLDDQISRGRKIIGDGDPLSSDFGTYWFDFTNKRPNPVRTTFLFRTREGGAGIVQILGTDIARETVHIRYRMVEPHPRDFQPKPFAAIPATPPFGPTREITLSTRAAGAICALNLDTNQSLETPDDRSFLQHAAKWMETAHMNVLAAINVGNPKISGLTLSNMNLVPVSPGAFDTLDSGMAALCARHPLQLPQNQLNPPGYKDGPSCGVFRTPGGTLGMIQIVSTSDNLPSVTLHYKVIQQPEKK